MKRDDLINMIWMQVLWFAAVLGATEDFFWPCLIVLVLFSTWQLQPSFRQKNDLPLMPVAILLGLVLDSTWVRLGWIEFASPQPEGFAPYWIIALWAGFALTINHSMGWLKQRLILAGFLGAMFGPLSYLSAQRLGALQLASESWDWFFGLAIGWGLALPFLLVMAKYLTITRQEPRDV